MRRGRRSRQSRRPLVHVSALIEHADGELARFAGKSSKFSSYYDQIVGVHQLPCAVRRNRLWTAFPRLGERGLPLGIIAEISVAIILALRIELEKRTGENTQPSFAGFEMDDILYCVGRSHGSVDSNRF